MWAAHRCMFRMNCPIITLVSNETTDQYASRTEGVIEHQEDPCDRQDHEHENGQSAESPRIGDPPPAKDTHGVQMQGQTVNHDHARFRAVSDTVR